jgi:serine/threonine protein kinase/formylglycine-generating enzyme required for sulfatase activity
VRSRKEGETPVGEEERARSCSASGAGEARVSARLPDSDGLPPDRPLSAALERLQRHTPDPGRYELVGEVARGGMGIIQRVRDGDLGRTIARKILGQERSGSDSQKSDPRTIGRFLEEAQITAQLEHPGIVPVHELGLDQDGVLYFTMRLVRGEDLHRVFEKVRSGADGWSTTRALGVLLKACEALAFAHRRGVVHRDLKPANVMVGSFGEVYVMDWGLAHVLDQPDTKDVRLRTEDPGSRETLHSDRRREVETPDSPLLTRDGDVVGTPAYMSPEQARGELERIGPRTDVYALGAMLYHLLGGEAPYLDPERKLAPLAILQRVLAGPPRALAELAPSAPPELLAICDKAMAREPEQRYPSVQDLAEDLRAYLELRVVRAYRTGALVELRKWIGRNRLSAVSLAGLLLALTGTGFVVAWEQSLRSAADRRRLNERTAESLRASLDELWPIHPDRLADMQAWLESARECVRYLAAAREELAEFERAHAGAPREDDPVALARKPDEFELQSVETRRSAYSESLALLTTGELPPDLTEDQADNELLFPEQNKAVLETEIAFLETTLAQRRIELGRVRTWRYEDPDLARQHERLARAVDDLESLARENDGAIATIERRAERSAGLRGTVSDHATEWVDAIASIADPRACPLYSGLTVTPQMGLVPLRRDPHSRLWEFWHVLSGERPARLPDGTLDIRPETGIVLILVPGGQVTMGAQDDDPGGPNYFPPEAGVHERMHAVNDWLVSIDLDPYFLSKYELTQGQWRRLADTSPATFAAGASYQHMARISLVHPVETVTWPQAAQTLWQHGLTLPTEAQWERAARAGSQAKYATGQLLDSVLPFANFADRAYSAEVLRQEDPLLPDDGFALHAPVADLRPTAWGFCGLFGNVEEWCLDWYGSSCERGSCRSGTGEHVPKASTTKACRGASFESPRTELWASCRNGKPLGSLDRALGVRPARPLTH